MSSIFEKVEQAKQEWESALDVLPQLICLIDGDGKLLRANRTIERWQLGNVTEIRSVGLHHLLHPTCTGKNCAVHSFLLTCQHEQQPASMEINDPHLARYVLIKAQPVHRPNLVDSKPIAIIIEDLTKEKTAEEALRQTNVALVQALAAKQEMLQNVSHELRTPLTMIMGYSTLLAEEELGPLTAEQQEAIQVLTDQSQRLHDMIERLLLLQSLDEMRLQTTACHLPSLLHRLLVSWRAYATQKGIRLTLDKENGEFPLLLLDAHLLEHVINNLLSNALKFSPSDSTVHVRLWTTEQEAHMAISDQGMGIASDKQPYIFERFYQVDGTRTRKAGGVGIGLALCRKIIQAHAGRIWVESEGEGKGTTFHLSLPLVQVSDA